MRLNKKGNHIGVILSFVIFIMFVTFLYLFIAPSLENRESRASKIDYLYGKIIENATQSMTVRGVKIVAQDKKIYPNICFRLDNFFENIPIQERKVIIQTTYDPPLGTYRDKDDIRDLLISTGKADDKISSNKAFVKVYNSSNLPPIELDIAPDNGLCVNLDFGTEYYVGYTREEQLVMANAIQSLILHYQTDLGYEQLKRVFGFDGDFGFNFTYQNGTNIGTTKYVPQSSEVYSQEYPVVYAASNRGLEVGTLSVRVW